MAGMYYHYFWTQTWTNSCEIINFSYSYSVACLFIPPRLYRRNYTRSDIAFAIISSTSKVSVSLWVGSLPCVCLIFCYCLIVWSFVLCIWPSLILTSSFRKKRYLNLRLRGVSLGLTDRQIPILISSDDGIQFSAPHLSTGETEKNPMTNTATFNFSKHTKIKFEKSHFQSEPLDEREWGDKKLKESRSTASIDPISPLRVSPSSCCILHRYLSPTPRG